MSMTHPKTHMVEYEILLFGIIRLKGDEKIPDTLIVPRTRIVVAILILKLDRFSDKPASPEVHLPTPE